MKNVKNKLMTAALALFLFVGMSSFQSVETDEDIAIADKNGEWISAGDELIDGVWYSVKQCVDGTRVKCVIGSKMYKKKRVQAIADDPVVVGLTYIVRNALGF